MFIDIQKAQVNVNIVYPVVVRTKYTKNILSNIALILLKKVEGVFRLLRSE